MWRGLKEYTECEFYESYDLPPELSELRQVMREVGVHLQLPQALQILEST